MSRFRGRRPEDGFRLIHEHLAPLAEIPSIIHVAEAACTGEHRRELHVHPVFELCYVLSGKAERVTNGEPVVVGPGDVHIVHPSERHSSRADRKDPYHHFSIAFDPRALGFMRSASGTAAVGSGAEDAGAMLEQRVVRGGQGAEHIFRRLITELDRTDGECGVGDRTKRALSIRMIQALVTELLVFVSRCFLADRARTSRGFALRVPVRPMFQELLDWMQARVCMPPSLGEMARRVGLSPAHFSTAFKREIGRTPIEHLTELRVDEAARRLIADNQAPIIHIASDLGFSSSQYFSMVFRKAKGCSPGEWRMANIPAM